MILEAICNGELCPIEHINPKDPDYIAAHHEICDILEKLSHNLPNEDYQLVQSLISSYGIAQCVECEAYFKFGFSVGITLQQEVQEQLQYLQEE